MGKISGPLILGCWIIFIVCWIVSARRVKAIAERQSLLSALAHRVPLGISYFLLVFRHLPPPLDRTLTPSTDWAQASGILICVLGLFITLWARWTLAGNWSSDVTFKQGHELIRSGPYQFVRHPIYTGLLLMCLGTALPAGKLHSWLAVPVMALAFWIKLTQEERLLLRHFPNDYPAYQKQVKALVPFIL